MPAAPRHWESELCSPLPPFSGVDLAKLEAQLDAREALDCYSDVFPTRQVRALLAVAKAAQAYREGGAVLATERDLDTALAALKGNETQ